MSDNLQHIILIGGGGHCKSCIQVIEATGRFHIDGILDVKEKVGEKILNYSITGTDDDLERYANKAVVFLITVGQIRSNQIRKKLYDRIKTLNLKLATVIAPDAIVSRYANIGEGTIIMHQAIVNADATVGVNCIVNTKALIEHDARIGDHCHISTAAVINGGTQVENDTFVGSGAVTREYISIPAGSFIKANSTVK